MKIQEVSALKLFAKCSGTFTHRTELAVCTLDACELGSFNGSASLCRSNGSDGQKDERNNFHRNLWVENAIPVLRSDK